MQLLLELRVRERMQYWADKSRARMVSKDVIGVDVSKKTP